MGIKYSIILPVKNGGAYIKECVASILNQTYKNFNLHILDNCSTDGTSEWIQSVNSRKIIYYLSDKDLSIEQNWARIKDIPKNEFMTMIGHDDLLHHDYLQEMNELVKKHPGASLYQTHFDFIDEKGKFIRQCFPMDEKHYAHEFLAKQMKRQIDSTGTGYMMRSIDFDALGGMPFTYPKLIFSDYEFWIKLMLMGYLTVSSKKCFSYRLHKSVSHMANGNDYQQAFCQYIKFVTALMQKNTSIKETALLHGKDFLMYYCEAISHRILKTPISERAITVAGFIKECESLGTGFIPGQEFKPLIKFRIRIAKILDQTSLGRNIFQLYRKL